MSDPNARYAPQVRFAPLGERGQAALRHAHVTIVGCGALGSNLANLLARAGVGYLRIVDRDVVELSNLHRQVLYDENDVSQSLPKAEAANRHLRRINSATEVEPRVIDFNAQSAPSIAQNTDLILDGTDNIETRLLINDLALEYHVPWVYGAVVGAEGRVLPILPYETACLRCIWPEIPAPGSIPTCDNVGVLSTAVATVAALQANEALKILTGNEAALLPDLVLLDVWSNTFRRVPTAPFRAAGDCPACHGNRRDFLSADATTRSTTLCGENAVQLLPAAPAEIDFKRLLPQLPSASNAKHNAFVLRFKADDLHCTLFADGRAIIRNTTDPSRAKSFYARYIGS